MSHQPSPNQETPGPADAKDHLTLQASQVLVDERSNFPMPPQMPFIPPSRDETHTRLVRLESLLEAFLSSKAQEQTTRNVPVPTELSSAAAATDLRSDRTSSYDNGLPPVSERIQLSLPIPLVDYKDPFATLRRWNSWHEQVTDPFYKNACGTHSAIATLLQNETNRGLIAGGPASLHRFEKAVLSDLLLGHRPTPQRDDELWHNFTDLFRTTLDVTSAQEEKYLFNRLFRNSRQPGESVYTFALEFKLAAGNFNQVSRTTLTEHNLVHFMIIALNFTSYPLLDLRQKLVELAEHGGKMSDILQSLSKFPELASLTRTEKQMSSQTTTSKVTGSRTFVTNVPTLADDSLFSELESDDAPGHFLGDGYNSDAILRSFKADKKALLFPESANLKDPLHAPTEIRSRNRHRSDFTARDRVIRDHIRQKLGSNCGRCFRLPSACSGPLANNKQSPCALLSGKNYIPPGWSHALKSILMWLTADQATQKEIVSAFYTHNGCSFGDFDKIVAAAFTQTSSKSKNSAYTENSQRHFVKDRPSGVAYSVTHRVNMLRRCLSILPDSGNPVVLAGLCWWRDYAALLHEAGLLTGLRKMASTEAMSFGDGPAEVPCFILLQVPLWYRYKTRGAQLVFTNIRIVENEVGLLDGKHNMAALEYTLRLSADVGRTSFALRKRQLSVVDTTSHFMVRLAKPRSFNKNEKGLAVVRQNACTALRAAVVSAASHFLDPQIGCEKESYSDDFPELKTGTADPGVKSGYYRYCAVAPRLWTNSEVSLPLKRDPKLLTSESRLVDLNHEAVAVQGRELTSVLCEKSAETSAADGHGSPKISVEIRDIPRLHKQFGHPSASQLLSLLRNGLDAHTPHFKWLRDAVVNFQCDFCAKRARRRTPSHPRVSIPKTSSPGQDLHLDIGHFVHPTRGPFTALLSTDKFSLYVGGAVLNGSTNARNTIEAFLKTTPVAYSRVTYDLGTNFRNADFKHVLERLGSEAWAVPTDAHWPSVVEKSIDLIRVELDAVMQEFSELSADAALQVSIARLNSRSLWAHDVTRATVHFGRDVARPALSEQLFALCPDWLPPDMADIEMFLDATDGKRRTHAQNNARMRLQTAL
jgi:hypothetical protein